jgi:hypothetical protein
MFRPRFPLLAFFDHVSRVANLFEHRDAKLVLKRVADGFVAGVKFELDQLLREFREREWFELRHRFRQHF